jgi:hypothetical protein
MNDWASQFLVFAETEDGGRTNWRKAITPPR